MAADTALLTVRADRPGATIPPALHGQFVEHLGRGVYGGIWVGEDAPIPHTRGIRGDVVAALRRLAVPVVRWPGGCFADGYHWVDGIGPREHRPARSNRSWGGLESNAFGSHEFLDFAEQVGAAPYVTGNVGTGSPGELADWLEYLTGDADTTLVRLRRRNGRHDPWRVPWVGIGNEPWGCGGAMRAEQYADELRRFCSAFPARDGVCRVAAGGVAEDPRWTDVLLSEAGGHLDAISLHWYTLPTGDWARKGPATGFDPAAWFATLERCLELDRHLRAHEEVLDRHDPGGRVALVVDEWGAWYDPAPEADPSALEQAQSLRDALVAALSLDVLHAHCARVRMANLAQLANVLQAVVLTSERVVVRTPTYHVFEMYRPFQGAVALPTEPDVPALSGGESPLPSVHASAGRRATGTIVLALVNLRPHDPAPISVSLAGSSPARAAARVLTAPAIDTVNSFDEPDAVRPVPFDSVRLRPGCVELELPARSATVLELW